MAKKNKELSFEEAVGELEGIISEMEQGDTSLEELVAKYSRGVELSQQCLQKLDAAEKAMDAVLRVKEGNLQEETLQVN